MQIISIVHSKKTIEAMRSILFLHVSLIVLSCNNQPSNEANGATSNVANKPKVFHKLNKSANFFSSRAKKDTFSIEIKGQFLTKSRVYFQIKSFENEVIFSEEFDVMDLYGWGPDVTNTSPDSVAIERHLIQRFDTFFGLEHFYSPAIKQTDIYEMVFNSILSKEDWQEIKQNPTSIGFEFTLGEESISYITYMENEKKVIVYKICC